MNMIHKIRLCKFANKGNLLHFTWREHAHSSHPLSSACSGSTVKTCDPLQGLKVQGLKGSKSQRCQTEASIQIVFYNRHHYLFKSVQAIRKGLTSLYSFYNALLVSI